MAYGSDHPVSNPKPMIKTHGMNGSHKMVMKSNAAVAAMASMPAPTNQPTSSQ